MSNHLAVAAVTSTIRHILATALAAAHPAPVGNAAVTTLPLDQLPRSGVAAQPGINVLLYLVTPNSASRLSDLPTRSASGALTSRPSAALDLHYLISGYGEDESLDGQRLLARAILALTASPVLTRDTVTAAVARYRTAPLTAFLNATDLAEQAELVKLTPVSLTIDELTRLWGGYPEASPTVSMAYRATVVVLEADVPVQSGLPVRRAAIEVQAAVRSTLDRVRPALDGAAVTAGSGVVLGGAALIQPLAPETRIAVGGTDLIPDPGGTALELRATISPAVPAGVQSVRVLHVRSGTGGEPDRVVGASNAVPLVVHPSVQVDPPAAGNVNLRIAPAIVPGQRVVVLLGRVGPANPSSSAVNIAPLPAGAAPVTSLTLPLASLPSGTWVVRVEVDGISSVADIVGDTYAGPTLLVP